jgi:Ca-activated chloride channel family protein
MKIYNIIFALCSGLLLQQAVAVPTEQVKLEVALGTPVLLAEQKQTVHLKITLLGLPLEKTIQRTPVNVAIVLDRSGSMSGQKIRQAKKAAIMAIDYLDSKDILSVVSYDDRIDVLVPATKMSDKVNIAAAIQRLTARGSTALFAGVSKGADEVRKFLEKNRVNRIILLSDGIANVGPSSPQALGLLGAKLLKEGISVTTLGLGLGYNEDLMTQLANKSDGNHAFIENSTDLAQIFKLEFGDLLSVVAQSVEVTIKCADGIKPIRILGREGKIQGQDVSTYLNQLYGNQEKYILLELEVPASAANTQRKLASIEVNYTNMATQHSERVAKISTVEFTLSSKKVEESVDKETMISTVEQIAVEKNKAAVKLRDQGRVKDAEKLLKENALYLQNKAKKYDSARLRQQSEENKKAAGKLEGRSWNKQRKLMRKNQHTIQKQQAY